MIVNLLIVSSTLSTWVSFKLGLWISQFQPKNILQLKKPESRGLESRCSSFWFFPGRPPTLFDPAASGCRSRGCREGPSGRREGELRRAESGFGCKETKNWGLRRQNLCQRIKIREIGWKRKKVYLVNCGSTASGRRSWPAHISAENDCYQIIYINFCYQLI